MSKRIETMIGLVKIEAKNLRKHATKEERNRIRLNVDPQSHTKCFYGLMTGHCYSERANELVKKCCTRVYEPNDSVGSFMKYGKLNGAPKELQGGDSRREMYHSPIETFGVMDLPNQIELNQEIVRYLRGDINKLELKVK